jgi:hypothetical protein
MRQSPQKVRCTVGFPAANNSVQATPVFAFLFVLSQVPGAPDDNRWADYYVPASMAATYRL